MSSSNVASKSPTPPRDSEYVVVPVNAATRAFLSQFSDSLLRVPTSDVPDVLALSDKKIPKKRVSSADDLNCSIRYPVNKKRCDVRRNVSSSLSRVPRTDRMAASPDSFVARHFKSTAPMKQAAPIVPVRGYESILPRTDRMAASLIHLLPVTLKAPRQ